MFSALTSTRMFVFLCAGVLLASPLLLVARQTTAAVPDPPPNPPPLVVYTYTVKIVCATDNPSGDVDFAGGGPVLGATEDVLADADLFQTAVNVFNPGRGTELNTRVFLAHDPGEARMSSPVIPIRIAEHDAVEFDCNDFRHGVPGVVPGGTGFFTIESLNELSVAAVYTLLEKTRCNSGVRTVIPGRSHGTDCHGAGASMDVEYITPRVVQFDNPQ
jgi:hypothetical protein